MFKKIKNYLFTDQNLWFIFWIGWNFAFSMWNIFDRNMNSALYFWTFLIVMILNWNQQRFETKINLKITQLQFICNELLGFTKDKWDIEGKFKDITE